jgi:Spy/CpxP family protein refolding chaperone
MVRHFAWAFAGLLLMAQPGRAADCTQQTEQKPAQPAQQIQAPAKPADHRDGQSHGRVKWWTDPAARTEFGITDQQSADIEKLWQTSLPSLRDSGSSLEAEEAVLSKMILNEADERTVSVEIRKVEHARFQHNANRTLLIYRMYRVLTPEQREKVDAKMKAMQNRDGRRDSSK